MMYKSQAARDRAFDKFFSENGAYWGVGDPREHCLLRWLDANTPIKRNHVTRKEKRKIVGLARSLGLYPIPEWWPVFKRIRGEKSDAMYLGNLAHSQILGK